MLHSSAGVYAAHAFLRSDGDWLATLRMEPSDVEATVDEAGTADAVAIEAEAALRAIAQIEQALEQATAAGGGGAQSSPEAITALTQAIRQAQDLNLGVAEALRVLGSGALPQGPAVALDGMNEALTRAELRLQFVSDLVPRLSEVYLRAEQAYRNSRPQEFEAAFQDLRALAPSLLRCRENGGPTVVADNAWRSIGLVFETLGRHHPRMGQLTPLHYAQIGTVRADSSVGPSLALGL